MPSSFIGEISRNTSKKGDNVNTIIKFFTLKIQLRGNGNMSNIIKDN
jgi:hypothetical protein